MTVSRVFDYCYFIVIALAQAQVPTSTITATPVTPAQSSSASFPYPRATETLVVNVVDKVVVEWKSNFIQNAFLYLWCDNGTPGNNRNWLVGTNARVNTTGTMEITPTSYVDKVTQDWTRPYACHLDLNYEDVYNKGVPGPGFNVTSIANQGITRTYAYLNTVPPLSPSSVSSGTMMLNTANTISSPTSNTASQPAAASDDNTGLSTGAIAGIAIGAITGFIVLVVLGFMVWRNKRKVAELQSIIHGGNHSMPQDELITSQGRYKNTLGHQFVPAELDPQSTQELPGSKVVVSNTPRAGT